MNRNTKKLVLGAKICALTMLGGCATSSIEDKYPGITKAERVLEEWGFASASAPSLSWAEEGVYDFELNETPDSYFKRAKSEINAGIAVHDQMVFALMANMTAKFDPINQAKYESALQEYQQAKSEQTNFTLSETQQQVLSDNQQFIEEVVQNNLETCLSASDKELTTAYTMNGVDDVDKRTELITVALTRRKSCLADYQASLNSISIPQDLEYPTLAENNAPAIQRLQSTPFLSKSSLVAPYSDNDRTALQANALPDEAAISQAVTNHFLQSMFSSLSKGEKSTLFGVSMISVNPGWRSMEDYKIQITIRPKIVYRPATADGLDEFLLDKTFSLYERAAIADQYRLDCSIKKRVDQDYCLLNEKDKQAILKDSNNALNDAGLAKPENVPNANFDITAISPVSYGQNMDLQNRQMSQFSLSLMLAASLKEAGVEKAAEVFADFSRQQKREYSSRNRRNRVNIFNDQSQMIGLEVGPAFYAAGSDGHDIQEGLQRETFPILMKLNAEQMQSGVFNKFVIARDCTEPDIRFCLLEARLHFSTTHRWLPAERNWTGVATWPYRAPLSTGQMRTVMEDVNEDCAAEASFFAYEGLKCEELQSKLLGSYVYTNLPKQKKSPEKVKKPAFLQAFPHVIEIQLDDKGKPITTSKRLVFTGQNLGLLKDSLSIDKVTPYFPGQTVKNVSLSGESLIIDVEISDNQGPLIFKFDFQGDKVTTSSTGAVVVMKTVPKKKAAIAKQVSIEMNDNQTKITLADEQTDLPDNLTKVLEEIYDSGEKAKVVPVNSDVKKEKTCKPCKSE
ncbi:hypothetical protein [Aliiglaciecola lipolytica]|uniref:Uncharacterized protein n=1 Tax=Aliiglaciecola lipolytica E3 TaxID=1127673 RepID=K6YRB5_9ALTE|nr:hypothetical protein [Aliiglaciecola lipolytica]GAC13825.1 hypothetical protein GLIP_1184 [Aliiglaciecola lipolytica E3]